MKIFNDSANDNYMHIFYFVTLSQGDLCESPLPLKTVRGGAGET